MRQEPASRTLGACAVFGNAAAGGGRRALRPSISIIVLMHMSALLVQHHVNPARLKARKARITTAFSPAAVALTDSESSPGIMRSVRLVGFPCGRDPSRLGFERLVSPATHGNGVRASSGSKSASVNWHRSLHRATCVALQTGAHAACAFGQSTCPGSLEFHAPPNRNMILYGPVSERFRVRLPDGRPPARHSFLSAARRRPA